MKPVSARVPCTQPITQNMIGHSIVDAGKSLREFAKSAWGLEFNSLLAGDKAGRRLPVYFNDHLISIKLYRPRGHSGDFVRLTLDEGLKKATKLSPGDIMNFSIGSKGQVILSIDISNRSISSDVVGKKSRVRPRKSVPRPFSFGNEGQIERHERWERKRCAGVAKVVKQTELKQFGRLCCHACGLQSDHKYGVEVIEAHHRKPLSECVGSRVPDPCDFDLLCPSCHRAIHKLKPCDLANLKRVIALGAK